MDGAFINPRRDRTLFEMGDYGDAVLALVSNDASCNHNHPECGTYTFQLTIPPHPQFRGH